jgi:predicted DNA-binding transcriptional regulator YafY
MTAATSHVRTGGQVFLAALLCAGLTGFPAPSQAQTPAPHPAEGLVLKADAASLCALVGKLQVIAFRYGYDPAAAELRELEPYAVGYTRQRNVLLFGRQVKGYSKSASDAAALPGWRNFRIDKIEKGVVNARVSTFAPVRPEPAEHRYIAEFVCKNEYIQQ